MFGDFPAPIICCIPISNDLIVFGAPLVVDATFAGARPSQGLMRELDSQSLPVPKSGSLAFLRWTELEGLERQVVAIILL